MVTAGLSPSGARSHADAVLRWAVDTSAWEPRDEEWFFLLDLLPHEDQTQVEAFKFKEDQKRAMVSRLLQRQCIHTALGVPWKQVKVKRTRGRKPFAALPPSVDKSHAPNFNFNVSHEGDYVVLASEPLCICGVDVAAPGQVRAARQGQAMSMVDLERRLGPQFTANEWETIKGMGPDHAAQEKVLRRLWSLKEAYVKARGDGLGFDLGKAEFEFDGHVHANEAVVRVEGKPLSRWRFFLQELGGKHWVSVARGPPEDIVDAWKEFTNSLQRREIPDGELQAALQAHNPPFTVLSVCDLLPRDLLAEYEEYGGTVF
eukprot:jgi/Botrbrau1/18228/Bobra.53_1s0084.1